MKVFCVIVLFFAAVAVGDDEVETSYELPLAEPCDQEACQLPDCRCSSTEIPGGLQARDTPQFVTITFDDGVNIMNILTYRDSLYHRTNKNGCPVGATFFINHEYTNYELVNELYNQGFEIALHSISHRVPQTYWAQATLEDMKLEFADQKNMMSHFANIPESEIKGLRIPFLQMTGNASFQMMSEADLEYDSTWATINNLSPGLWPYTLDYASTQECMVPPCPTASIPGPWVKPMVAWLDLEGNPCAMVDTCFFVPALDDEDGWFEFIVTNFERQYLSNRAPFGFYAHEWYISANPAIGRALVRFMDMINNLEDVFMVNAARVVEWSRNPVPVTEYQKECRRATPATCNPRTCGPLNSEHNEWSSYWITVCSECPRTYPWLGNPLGE